MDKESIERALMALGLDESDYRYKEYPGRDKIPWFDLPCILAPYKEEHEDEITGQRNDKHPSAGIRVDKTNDDAVYKCFTCGTSNGLRYILKQLYSKTNENRYKKALELTDPKNIDTLKNRMENDPFDDNEEKQSEVEHDDEIWSESELDVFERAIPKYFLNRGYSVDIGKKFGVRYDDELKRFVIPVRRYDGGLVGVIGRSILPKEKRDAMNASNRYTKKYYVYGNFSRSRYLFGSHFIDDNDIDSLFMVEGTLDVIRMHDLGYENTVGVLGSEVSDRQMSKALDYNVPIYLMLDGDSAGKKGMEKAYEQYKKQGSLKVIELDKVTKYLKDKGDDDIIIKDPDDFESKDQVEFAKECAIDEISRKLSSLNK